MTWLLSGWNLTEPDDPLEEFLRDFISFEDGKITSKIKWNEYFICEMNNVVKP